MLRQLPFAPNSQQQAVAGALARFCERSLRPGMLSSDRAFVLNGYAGTGKTSLTAGLVRALRQWGVPTVLLAPTGRAAKVFAAFSGMPAYTVHRRIYRHSLGGETPGMQTNNLQGAVFVVDEASMISDRDEYGGTNLLRDLLMYVYSGVNCCLIFVGDTAQLPPVGCDESPAMNPLVLQSMGLSVSSATLTAVVRQGQHSGILANATWQRRVMNQIPAPAPRLFTKGYNDVRVVSGEDLPDAIATAYSHDGLAQTIVVTRSNMRATAFNMAIRTQVLYHDDEIARDDRIMVAKNNYYWSRRVKGLDFVANGEIATVAQVYGTEIKYGMLFADVCLRLDDSELEFEAKIMLDTLRTDFAALDPKAYERLYQAIMADPELFASDTPVEVRRRVLRDNPYWNALQVKYAYCVTCHKAQGGQWQNVFVDMGYIHPDSAGLEFYRWLYTATTRARHLLQFVNPDPDACG